MVTTKNPYTDDGPICDPKEFWGRTSEIARIFSRIDATRPQSISIIGEPKIGKTSLLRYIQFPEIQMMYLEAPEKILMLGWEMPGQLETGPEEFFNYLSRLISQRINITVNGSGYEGFQNIIKNLKIAAFKLILCFDDFQRITENPNYPMEFYSFLRSVANSYNVAYITSSPLELQRLCFSTAVEESPFFNIFTNIPLRRLKRNEALKAIIEPSKAGGNSLEPYAADIIEWVGTAPYDLKIACRMLFDRLQTKTQQDSDPWSDFKSDYYITMGPIMKERWQSLSPELQSTIMHLITRRKILKSQGYLAAELDRKGYLGKETDAYTIKPGIFAQYIANANKIKSPRDWRKKFSLKNLFR